MLHIPVTNRAPQSELNTEKPYAALLYRIVQLGQQKYDRRILLSWVLPEVERPLPPGVKEGIDRHVIHKEYTESLFESATLRVDINRMVGHDLLKTYEGTNFELTSLLGSACLLWLDKSVRKEGYANQAGGNNRREGIFEIAGIAPFPEDDFLPPNTWPLQSLTFKNFDWKLFDSLSSRLRLRIESAPEFAALSRP